MPRRKSTAKLVKQEGRIQLAISDLKTQKVSSVKAAAELYRIPRTTLRDRLNGAQHRPEARANGLILTAAEEESLVRWILSLDQRGASPRPSHVQIMANLLLAKRGSSTPKRVGANWSSKFIKRRPELKSSFSQQYNYQRAKCEEPEVIKKWFERIQIVIMQHGIALKDIYNFNETGYAMGLVATAKVVTRADLAGKPCLFQAGNREWVTSIECIGSTGYVLPLCIIFKGKVHIQGWYEDEALPDNWRIEVSDMDGQLM